MGILCQLKLLTVYAVCIWVEKDLENIFPAFFASFNPGGGGGYSMYHWLGRCGAGPHTLTRFKTNIADFPTHFKTEFRFLIPC